MDPDKHVVPVSLQAHDIDLVAIFAELLLQDLQAGVDKYGSYGKWLPAKRAEDVSND